VPDHGTAIEWTQAPGYKGETWNPVTGCDRVSPGCANCYALDLAARLKRMGQKRYQRDGDPKSSGPGFGLTLHPDKLEEPLRWRKPRMVFVNSMSDLFHEEIPDSYIARVFSVMAEAGQHVFQVLTKRPERMRDLLQEWDRHDDVLNGPATKLWPPPNVWLGTSIENRRFIHRADLLRETPAAVRFISAEPLLGPLVYDDVMPGVYRGWRNSADGVAPELDLTDIDWLICGGESGSGHRRIDPQWVRDLRDAAVENETAFFVKQGSGLRSGMQGTLPDDLWAYKEFPSA
jgi:protein gp37